MSSEDIVKIERPSFDQKTGKYVLIIYYRNIDMSYGLYSSDLGDIIEKREYSNKFDYFCDYKEIMEKINTNNNGRR